MFEQRYNAPEAGNLYYIHVSAGGYNKCIKVTGNSVLPNCTGYAYGRYMEAGNVQSCNLPTCNAQDWYKQKDGYVRGQTPRVGSVMCWDKKADGKYGHVAIVEEIHADGSVTASMSNYPVDGKQLPYWERKTYKPPYNTETGLPFQGFIYNPYVDVDAFIKEGASDVTINDHKYALYRQSQNEECVVLAAGINKVASIRNLNADVYVMGKVTGANYFQMRTDQADPVNTTYGDLSAPLNNVWTEVPNQDTTLYFDVETGAYGDCTGIHVRQDHNVFSPALVYPKTGNYQYARMIEQNNDKGAAYLTSFSRYSFVIRFTDKTYAVGIAMDAMTPLQIANDFRILPNLESIAFLDGGGSAQFGRWNGQKFEYVRDTGRECPSAVAIISKSPYTPEEQPEQGETEESGETVMPEEKPAETPEIKPIEDWVDPEPKTNIIVERIAALMSVKSIITLILTGAFCYLVINRMDLPDKFVSIYTMCISFFFGTQFQKQQK